MFGIQLCDFPLLFSARGLSAVPAPFRPPVSECTAGRGQSGLLRLWESALCSAVSGLDSAQLSDRGPARDAFSTQPGGHHAQHSAEPRDSLCLQVHRLPDLKPQHRRGPFPETRGPDSSHRHLLFHLSGTELYHRRLSPSGGLQPEFSKALALYLLFPAADCRTYRPLGRYLGAD